jgi:methyl-accepting chemotaxis protein
MMRLAQLSVKAKLVGGFLAVAVITAGVGAVGYYGLYSVSTEVDSIGHVALPTVRTVGDMNQSLLRIKAAQRTLLDANLPLEDRQRQYHLVNEAEKCFAEARKQYEPLPQLPEEGVIWKEFVAAYDRMRQENEKFF